MVKILHRNRLKLEAKQTEVLVHFVHRLHKNPTETEWIEEEGPRQENIKTCYFVHVETF